MASLDICVVTWKTPVWLQRFIVSYGEISRRESRLITRINEPTRADIDVIENMKEHIDGPVSMGDNLGYARSVNMLAAQGDGEIIGIFNADAELTDDVWDCVQYMEDHLDIGVLGPRQTDSRGRLTCGGGVVGTQSNPGYRAWNRKDTGQFNDDITDVVGVMGAAYFVRRSVWEELTSCPEYVTFLDSKGEDAVGAFLPTKHWYEETFCSYHVREHGYRVVYYGPALLHHASKKSGPPPGGHKKVWNESKELFMEACDAVHGMEREK